MAMEAFVSTNRRDYIWPFPKPVVNVPSQPAKLTQPRSLYPREIVDRCKCDGHNWDPMYRRYLCLADKEKELSDEVAILRTELTNTEDVLEHPCDGHDAKMESLYCHDYTRSGFAVPDFNELVKEPDNKPGGKIKCKDTDSGRGDPTRFRLTPMELEYVPKGETRALSVYTQKFPGPSEYEDTISRNGKALVLATQQYRQPLVSSRSRLGDPCCK